MTLSVALAALVALPLPAIEAIPRHVDVAIFVVALVGLLVGHRFSSRQRIASERVAHAARDDA